MGRRKRRKRKSKRKGSPYERVVAEVIRVMDPNATVEQGQWVLGPDGHRELDVHIIGTYEGQERRILIECKDFNPASTGPVGIRYIDALESKSRDLGFHFSAICSNAGFTINAIRKASRVGIGLIAVMKKGDKRIRFAVTEEIYTRKVHVNELKISLEGPEPILLEGMKGEVILFNGMPVVNWVMNRAMLIIGGNPIVAGSYTDRFPLTQKLSFTLPSGSVLVSQLNYHIKISGGWFAQQVTLDATHGIYDWLRHRVRLAPGPGKFLIQGVDVHAGSPIEQPPTREIESYSQIAPGEFQAKLLFLTGLETPDSVPDIEKYIRPEDLDLRIPDLLEDAYISVSA